MTEDQIKLAARSTVDRALAQVFPQDRRALLLAVVQAAQENLAHLPVNQTLNTLRGVG